MSDPPPPTKVQITLHELVQRKYAYWKDMWQQKKFIENEDFYSLEEV